MVEKVIYKGIYFTGKMGKKVHFFVREIKLIKSSCQIIVRYIICCTACNIYKFFIVSCFLSWEKTIYWRAFLYVFSFWSSTSDISCIIVLLSEFNCVKLFIFYFHHENVVYKRVHLPRKGTKSFIFCLTNKIKLIFELDNC